MAATPSSLHTDAVEAEKHLEALATGLASAGAGDSTVKAVTQCADLVREVIKALGKGQEQTGDEEPPAEEGASPSSYEQAAAETGAAMHSAAK